MITSTANNRVRAVQNLQKKRAERERTGTFVIEGARSLREAPADALREIYLTEAWYRSLTDAERKRVDALPAEHLFVSEEVMRKLSDTMHPQGVLAVAAMRKRKTEELFSAAGTQRKPLLIVLEHLQDPGNLGTIFRTAEGAGVTGIFLTGSTADPYSPKVVRGTMGSVFRVPFLEMVSVGDCVRELKERGVTLCATDPAGGVCYTDADFSVPTAFLIGNEGAGLSEEAMAASDIRVQIPMAGELQSLNAAVSTAILVYEAMRQRRVQV